MGDQTTPDATLVLRPHVLVTLRPDLTKYDAIAIAEDSADIRKILSADFRWKHLLQDFPGVSITTLFDFMTLDAVRLNVDIVDAVPSFRRLRDPFRVLSFSDFNAPVLASEIQKWLGSEVLSIKLHVPRPRTWLSNWRSDAVAANPPTYIPADLTPYTADQIRSIDADYLQPAPLGNGISNAWALPGGLGDGIRIADVEAGWNLGSHYGPGISEGGRATPGSGSGEHGAAILSVLFSPHDGVAMKGIAPKSTPILITTDRNKDDGSWAIKNQVSESRIAFALCRAMLLLEDGDVICLPKFIAAPGKAKGSIDDFPVEIFWKVKRAIQIATMLDITVIEAAANSSVILDQSSFEESYTAEQFPVGPNSIDSGAIMVGACHTGKGRLRLFNKQPQMGSNYGSRIDCFAQGENVVAANGNDNWSPADSYSKTFGYTSAATAIISGIAAMLQGIRKANHQPPLSPWFLRQLLSDVTSGTPSQSPELCGVSPNLQAILTRLQLGGA